MSKKQNHKENLMLSNRTNHICVSGKRTGCQKPLVFRNLSLMAEMENTKSLKARNPLHCTVSSPESSVVRPCCSPCQRKISTSYSCQVMNITLWGNILKSHLKNVFVFYKSEVEHSNLGSGVTGNTTFLQNIS
ncbi:unnamed protein product [Pipistrellus nathusii]|uniref:Uncharacterized protein n=1 Tax=Pipistrellus nathusii TaxID=59473 RepID=A0ABP0A1R3_PIPNA